MELKHNMKHVFGVWVLLIGFGLLSGVSDAALLGEWKFDGNANDSSGNGRDGTLFPGAAGSIQFVDEGRGGCVKYTNAEDRIAIPATTIGTSFSVVAWTRWDGQFGDWQRFITSHFGNGFYIGREGNTNSWKFIVNGNFNMTTGQIVADQWQHIAATYNGTTKVARLYINGQQSGGDIIMSDPSQVADVISIGKATGEGESSLTGLIDEVKIYNHTLTASDVSNFYNAEYLQAVSGPTDRAVWSGETDTATFDLTIDKAAGSTVTDIQWYKKAAPGDPNILLVDDDVKYDIEWSQDDASLTVYDVDASDAANTYHAVVTLDAGSPSVIESRSAGLQISDGLVHRWSFSGNLTDSVAAADGILYDPNGLASYVDGDTQLLLDNRLQRPLDDPNDMTYVQLPGGLISPLNNFMTLELWATPHRINNDWTTMFAFGDDNDGDMMSYDGGGTGLIGSLQLMNPAGGLAFTYQATVARWFSPSLPVVDEPFMYTMVWDGNTNTGRFYLNGEEIASGALPATLATVNDVDNLLGVAYWNDLLANISFDELRIYDYPLPSYYIYAHNEAGPDELNVELLPAVNGPQDVGVYPDMLTDDTDSATFTVVISNLPPTTTVADVKWYHDDVEVVDDGSKYIIAFDDTESTLTINDVAGADAGDYYAEVTLDTSASQLSDTARLTLCGGLAHRWSFSGNLTDSVGSADGTLYDPKGHASYVSGNTQLLLDTAPVRPATDPNAIVYVALPDGLVSSLDNYMTIEIWMTPHRINGDFTSLFAFGADDDGDPLVFTDGTGLLGQLQILAEGPGFSHQTASTVTRWSSTTPPVADEPLMLAMVWDGNANTGLFYLNGVEMATGTLSGKLSAINDVDNLLGMGYWNDLMLNASIDELRIYDWGYDAPWIEAHYDAGPDVLYVNPCINPPEYDLDGDCKVGLADFAKISVDWLKCGRIDSCD